MSKIQYVLLTLLSFSSLCFAQNYVRFFNALDEKTISITSDVIPPISNLNFMQATDYTALTNSGSTFSVTILDSNNASMTGSPLTVTTTSNFTSLLVVMLNTTVSLVPYVESFSTAPVNSTLTWLRVINAANSALVNLMDSNSNTIFSNVGYLQGTPYMVVDPTVTKFLLTSNANMSFSITPTFATPNNTANSTTNILYTVVAYMSATNGFSGGFYMDRSFTVSNAVANTTNSTTNATTSGNFNMTSGHATTGVNVTAKATTGVATTGKTSTSSKATTSKATTSTTTSKVTSTSTSTSGHVSSSDKNRYGYAAVVLSVFAMLLI